ncbi:MAG: SDR family oxidoreductase [Lewinellaceae bacterium]|nr:SDR family oxidoreductase [Lewinellaceae bacterium]
MKILLTGATGYIAQRLLPVLIGAGHEVLCCVRDRRRFNGAKHASPLVQVIEVDFLDKQTLSRIPEDIDVAYYLIHSMATTSDSDFESLEALSAQFFKERLEQTRVRQVIYLSGIVNEEQLSRHLTSRKNVETILSSGTFALTTLRAGIIVGSGSASFEIIRDLVEKLPVMIAPRWLNTRSQPIAIRNVVEFLHGVLLNEATYRRSFDIGGPEVLSYKEMLLRFAQVRGLKRRIFTVPVMTPKLSSYWLYFVTATSYTLAINLVNSMKVEVIARDNNLREMLGIRLIGYDESIRLAFDKIEQNQVVSSWKDALTSNILHDGISRYIQVPVFGCFKDSRTMKTPDPEQTLRRIWAIGGATGWYYGNWLWRLRGFLDKLAGGVGLRRGRKSPTEIAAGEALDFWRVLLADKTEKRLLLYAEMKLPGEAWLEFKINDGNTVTQTATFRPWGLWGRLYWYAVLPFHGFIFKGMLRRIAE